MDRSRTDLLAELLAGTPLVEDARRLGAALRRPSPAAGGLLLVGTPEHEPWHLTAHLDEEARYAALPDLSPTLVRWRVPAGAPAHLAVDLSRLEAVRRGERLLVVAPDEAPVPLLERADDARRRGALIVCLDRGDDELGALAAERMVVPAASSPLLAAGLTADVPPVFDVAQHLLSAAAGEAPTVRRGWRTRLEALLEKVSGPAPPRH